MATKSEIAEHFLAHLQNLLGPPKRHDVEGFYEVVVEVLEPFTIHQLESAAKQFKRTWQHGYWPTPQKMADACDKFPREPRPEGELSNYERFERGRKARDRRKLDDAEVLAMLRGPMAVDAAQNGWAKELFDFVKERRELPLPGDEATLKETASRVWHQQEAVLRGEFLTEDGEVKTLAGPVKAIQAMAQAMRDREAKIAAHILNTNTTQEAS